MRKAFLLFFLFFLLSLPAQGAEKVRYANHFKATAYYGLPAIAALEKGFFEERGLEVKYLPFDGAALMMRGLAAGEVDVASYGFDTAVMAVTRKVPTVLAGDPKMVLPFILWVLADSPLKEPTQLKGTKVGITALGVLPQRLAIIALSKLGLEKEVRYIAVGTGAPAVAALKARITDSLALSFFALLPLKARGEVRELLVISDYAPEGRTSQVIMAHREFARKNPEAVRKTVDGFMRGAAFVLENEAWAVDKMKADFGYTEEAARLAFAKFRYGKDARISKEKVRESVEFLVEGGEIKRAEVPPLETYYIKEMAD